MTETTTGSLQPQADVLRPPGQSSTGPMQTIAHPLPVERTDPGWATAAALYIQAKRSVESAQATQLRAKEALVALTEHPCERGFGVTVSLSDDWRDVDNARTTALLGVDLELTSGKGCVGATVSIDV